MIYGRAVPAAAAGLAVRLADVRARLDPQGRFLDHLTTDGK
ncbi:hypothetical protein ACIGG9_28425 [Pseudonocardia alni]